MLELLCKISFFLFMLIMYAYVTSTREVVIIVLGYILCVFSYYYFDTIKTAIDEFLNYVHNHGVSKTNINPPHVTTYAVNKKYNKVNNTVNVPLPPMNDRIFGPICRNSNAFPRNPPPVFNCKFNNFILNGGLPSPIMKNGLSVENGNHCMETMKLPMQNMKKRFNNLSSSMHFRNNSRSGRDSSAMCKKYNNNLDMETYMNVKSPGFTGRIVDKALESASYHIKYPAVKQISAYRFDKSTLRHLSKIPRINTTSVVRIAPPEPTSIHLLNDIEKKLDKNEIQDPDFLQGMKGYSRKRNYSQEEAEKSTATAKKSRKNNIKNFTINQYKRTLDDKSRDVLDDISKKRCDDYNRGATKMVVYAPSLATASSSNSNGSLKKRKSTKSDKSKNECFESTEKCRRIDKPSKDIRTNEFSNERKPQNYSLKSNAVQPTTEAKLVNVSDQQLKKSQNEPVDDDDFEYVRVASGKILNRTNRSYRRKLNSNKIDPISVIASEPEVVGEITGADDVAMKEHLLQNLLSNIERKDRKDEKVIFYKNSIIEEVSKKNSEYNEPPQQVPNPLFTERFADNEEEIDMNNMTAYELEERAINAAYLVRKQSPGLAHSTPATSNFFLHNSYSDTSVEDFNVKNGLNFIDSGYDSSSAENSINNISSGMKGTSNPKSIHVNEYLGKNSNFPVTASSTSEQISAPVNGTLFDNSYNKFKSNPMDENCVSFSKYGKATSSSISFSSPSLGNSTVSNFGSSYCFGEKNAQSSSSNGFGITQHRPPTSSNSESKSNGLFGTTTALFGSGDSNFFNPVNTKEPSLASFSALNCDSKTSLSYNFATGSQKKGFGFGNGESSTWNSTPSLQNQSNFSFAGNAPVQSSDPVLFEKNIGSASIPVFNIGAGGSSRNRVTRNGRNK